MAAVVQATCPGCKQVLRIPAEWLGQAFKCKHCGTIIQARTRPAANGAPAAVPAPTATSAKPMAKPVAAPIAAAPRPKKAKPANGAPFSFEDDGEGDEGDPAPRSRLRRGPGGGLLKGLVLGAAVLVVAAVATVLAFPYLSGMAAHTGPHASARLALDDDGGPPDERVTFAKATAPRGTRKTDLPRPDTARRPNPDPPAETHKRPADTGKKPKDLPKPAGPFPRLRLLVSVNNYLYANPINYGMPGGTNVHSLADRFSERNGLRVPATQVGELSDAAPERLAVPPTEPVLRGTISEFLDTSRAQDRIILLIVGHVIEVEGEPCLLAIDGDADSKGGHVPLKWVYERLAACKARQKVLVLDTCRLNPAKGQERPGSGPMGEKLDAMLKVPPAGVQVWSACVAGQYSYEFEDGEVNNGLFLNELQKAAFNVTDGTIASPADAFPLARLEGQVNARMKAHLGKSGKVQTSRLSGSEAEGGAAPDASEAMPPKPRAVPPPPRPGGSADLATVCAILKDISFPPLKVARESSALTAEALPPFPAALLKDYLKDGAATPLRAEVMKARAMLAGIAKGNLPDRYAAPVNPQLKNRVKGDQKAVAKIIADLQDQGEALKGVEPLRKDETKRWQATYDYVVARVEAQLSFLNEYEAVLGQILKDAMPPLGDRQTSWRLASQHDSQTGDSTAKKLATESRKKLDKIIAAYPDTPWEVMAKRDKSSALGLEWQPTRAN